MLPSWRQCRFFVTINGVSYKKVLPYRGAHHFHVVAKSSYRAQNISCVHPE